MAKNKDYWCKRMEALEDDQYRKSAAYYKDVQNQFRKASNSIQMDIERWYLRLADNNDISYAGAKRLLKKSELEEFHWSVEQYVKAGTENALDQRWMRELENASARHHISYLEAMKLQVRQHAELLSAEFEGGMTDFLRGSYKDGYYKAAFEISRGTGVGVNLARLDSRGIDAVIRKPWARDGTNFSDRIWSNKEKLVNNLHMELTQNIIRGESPKKAVDSLAKTMDVSKSQAGRLIMTETAAISSAATKDSYGELGVERYEVLATLDGRTSEVCRDFDGKVFDIKDYAVGETAPPFHPNCRSTTIPYFDDEFGAVEQRAARDGETVYVDGSMNYREWEKQYASKDSTEENQQDLPKISGQKTKYSFNKERGIEKAIAYQNEDGVKFIYPNGYDKSRQKISPEKAMKVFEKVPKNISVNIDTIEFVDYQNPKDQYWEKTYGIKDFVSYATGGNRKITFYANDEAVNSDVTILETYLHEGGHIFDKEYKKVHESALSATQEYVEAMEADKKHNGRKYISDYAEESQSEAEDFADFVTGYFMDSDYYAITAPNRTRLLKEELER